MTTLRLTPTARLLWSRMAEDAGESQSDFLEALIRREAKRRKLTLAAASGETPSSQDGE